MFALFADVDPTGVMKQTVEDSTGALQASFKNAWVQIVDYTPRVLAAVLVFVIGYFVARLVARAITLVCERAGLQRAAERSGLWESMSHMSIRRNVPAILGTIVFWGLMLVFLMASFNILEIREVSTAISQVVAYIPNLLVATVMVVVGSAVGLSQPSVIRLSREDDDNVVSTVPMTARRTCQRNGPNGRSPR